MALDDIPEIILLCIENQHISAFNEALANKWPSFLRRPKLGIRVVNGTLDELAMPFQLIVSPANSYGRLDGGFDHVISHTFCRPHLDYDTLTNAAQAVLYERWRGFAPPGTCTLAPFPEELEGKNEWGCKWVALCPTMRISSDVTWDREVVYECIWSLMCELERFNRGRREDRIGSILITPLATGVGGVSKERWATQFVLALKHYADSLQRPKRWSNLRWSLLERDAAAVRKTWKV
ncbi:hypothetical protein BDV59DRAFT_186345 [Aspergillus ambiguus]|uniref:uncharacterized protein n=1 Tax=Aspergillus ambiguus TaxID=176160 RepID=UPI003CCDD205